MNVEVSVNPLLSLPALHGAHELAWSYLLDAVFADAYHAELRMLRLSLPSTSLLDDVHTRAELSYRGEGSGSGVALMSTQHAFVQGAQRVYHLEFGALAPGVLRGVIPFDVAGFRLERQLSVYSWQARFYGLPIRLSGWLKRPYLQDRAVATMRRAFACEGSVPAYYHLSIWSGS